MSSSRYVFLLPLLLVIGTRDRMGFALTLDKVALYENCTVFDKSDIYGGPVCGDNGVTYANSLYLDCKNHYTRDTVATLHSGPCLENEEYCSINLYYEPVCGSDRKIYTNMQSLLCVRRKQSKDLTAVPMKDCQQNDYCYRSGTEHYGVNPVCANNGLTYQNAAQLKCLQRHNPDLNVISNGECDTHSHESCIEAHTNTTVLPNGEYANDAFTADDEVCGNDGRTYQSIHHLQCHTRHDKYLFLKHDGPCSGPDDHPCGSVPEEEHRQPVCGIDGRSYVSPEALWCAKLRSPEKDIAYRHDGPC
ncbi:serine protease inhibitor dipetalogastin-like [Pogonomyrmex barbatus]|uniref:Serine protease inhibitor dipetalogastin-like n=1 Tax=Pogonomyrmex barbatus TaxID=144034 RepID=A0A6I9W2B8_9HYME|nr:serine protease inhibitor dipetalogastin-like [Pogonomyrmex barbatus]